jgi:hypothetical protein
MDDRERFERDVAAMLEARVANLPAAYDIDPALVRHARRKRATKLAALAVAAVVVLGGTSGVIAQTVGRDDSKHVMASAPTSTVPRPGVPTVACAKEYPGNVRGTRVLPSPEPRVPTAGDPAVLSTLVWFAGYTDAREIVLGPKSWSCQLPLDHNALVVYDPAATGGRVATVDEAPITVENDGLWDDLGALLACSVFDDPAVTQFMVRVNAGCLSQRTPRRTVTRVDAHVATFVDADAAHGVGWMQLPSSKNATDGHISVLTCRPTAGLTVAACDTIIADFIARNDAEATVHTVVCPSTAAVGNEQPSSPTAPTTEPGVPPAGADQLPTLQYFSGGSGENPRYVVLGPDSWSCLGRSTDSGSSRVVYDPNATPGRVPGVDAASIALQNEVWDDPAGARLLCSVFDDATAVEFTRRSFPDSCPTSPAPRRTVTRVSGDVATFVDPNGDRGAGWMIEPAPELQEPGRVSLLTCRPSAELTTATCDAIVADYAARLNDGSPRP